MTAHIGTLMSGEVKCGCGWSSGHFSFAADAEKEFERHLKEVKGEGLETKQLDPPDPTDFDLRALSLEKACMTHGFKSGGFPASADEVVQAAEKYEKFLRGEKE